MSNPRLPPEKRREHFTGISMSLVERAKLDKLKILLDVPSNSEALRMVINSEWRRLTAARDRREGRTRAVT